MFKSISVIAFLILFSVSIFGQNTLDLKADAVELTALSDIPASVRRFVNEFRFIAVGEFHGTQEAPAFVQGICEAIILKKEKIVLCLEMPKEMEPVIEAFIKSGDTEVILSSDFFQRERADGRSSEAMVALLNYARTKQEHIMVRCFLPERNPGDSELLDSLMARKVIRIISSNPYRRVVLLAGNLHCRRKVGLPGDKNFKSMFRFIIEHKRRESLSLRMLCINQVYAGGSAWNCRKDECKEWEIPVSEGIFSRDVKYAHYFLGGKDAKTWLRSKLGIDAILFSRKIHSSPPAKK